MNITNPIFWELKKLKLINSFNLIELNNKTRDKKIKVFKDKKTKIIFLEKNVCSANYYETLKFEDYDRKPKKNKNRFTFVKTLDGKIKTPIISDDYRRAKQFKKQFKNKNILDFGCRYGAFLNLIRNAKSLYGIELNEECISFIKKNLKKIKISNNLKSLNKKFDLITMFHVLEHMPSQINTLKILKSKLKKKGKIIIEVPHAEDFLILQEELKEFKNFTFWSEHLILHTYNSLKTMLLKAGFKKIKIEYYQRYNFENHLGWFVKRKPGGHEFYKNIFDAKLNNFYSENLRKLRQTDTLIAIAEK